MRDLAVGDIVLAKAWWDKDRILKCEVISTPWGNSGGVVGDRILNVKPLEGNPHARTIRESDVDRVLMCAADLKPLGGPPAEEQKR